MSKKRKHKVGNNKVNSEASHSAASADITSNRNTQRTEESTQADRDALTDQSRVNTITNQDNANSVISQSGANAGINNSENEENVLFTTLSLLTIRGMKLSRYEYTDGTTCMRFIGVSQQEPCAKLVLRKLAREGKTLDRIVVLESGECRRNPVAGISDKFWTSIDGSNERTAVVFFKKRICDYLRGDGREISIFDENDKDAADKNPRTKEQYDSYREYNELFDGVGNVNYDNPYALFCDIEFESNEEGSVAFLDRIIKGIKGESNKKINLYIDTTGGLRNTMLQINAIIDLLKDQNVAVKGKYATDYSSTNFSNNIRETSAQYRSYELVSAMAEFKRYGRGKGLVHFFYNQNTEGTTRILNTIEKISGAIAICNIEGFESGLRDLRSINEANNGDIANITDSELRFVLEDIFSAYKSLLEGNLTPFKIVKWCAERYFYQQAFTIIEARMPSMLIERGFFNCDLGNRVFISNNGSRRTIREVYREVKGYASQDDEIKNWVFTEWVKSNSERVRNERYRYFGANYRNFFNGRLSENWRQYVTSYIDESNCCEIKQKYKYWEFSNNMHKNTEPLQKLRLFSALSLEIKTKLRNGANHAAIGNITEEKVRDVLNAYIEIGESLGLSEEYTNNAQPADEPTNNNVEAVDELANNAELDLSGLSRYIIH